VLRVAHCTALWLVMVGEAETAGPRTGAAALAAQEVRSWMHRLRCERAACSEDPALYGQLPRHLQLTPQQRQQAWGSATRFVEQALPMMRGLAAALQALWQQQPERQQQVQLDLAQAAAGRPGCSYLRCAEVQGGKSKRCSGCRIARFCSVACQHNDWRQGGHKQVCRLLGVLAMPQDAS